MKMNNNYSKALLLLLMTAVLPMAAQQLPVPYFENWGDKFNGDKQLTD